MCSTPKPKRRVKVKTANASVGILSGMSSEKRQSFAQRANQASARRIEAKKLKHQKQNSMTNISFKRRKSTQKKAKTNKHQFWLFLLIIRFLKTPIHDLMRKLVFPVRKQPTR